MKFNTIEKYIPFANGIVLVVLTGTISFMFRDMLQEQGLSPLTILSGTLLIPLGVVIYLRR